MITITDKKLCCGCSACAQHCPKQCITMKEDQEGFLYPQVDTASCINCSLCEKVCPILNPYISQKPNVVFAAKNNNDEIRLNSSSGGLFFLFAEKTIKNRGVVFGACYDSEWRVVHSFTERIEDVHRFLGSKYVQSYIGNSYKQAELFLKSEREVLFSGTPCQISGLLHYLGRRYENLITIDVLCHGVPSPLLWKNYVEYIAQSNGFPLKDISSISFRSKRLGWVRFGLEICARRHNGYFQHLGNDAYLQAFLKNLNLRPSCYHCAVRCGRSHSDISIGDFWGVKKHFQSFDDDKGVSAVLINTLKGQSIYDAITSISYRGNYEMVLEGNPVLEKSVQEPILRDDFWKTFFAAGINGVVNFMKDLKPKGIKKIIAKIKEMAKCILKYVGLS